MVPAHTATQEGTARPSFLPSNSSAPTSSGRHPEEQP